MSVKLWAVLVSTLLLGGGALAFLGSGAQTGSVQTTTVGGGPHPGGGTLNVTTNVTVRISPQTLNLRSQGKYVTVHLYVTGVNASAFNLSALQIAANGTNLTIPDRSPSNVQVQGNGTAVVAMFKLDRQELIRAFGVSGDYEVTVKGPVGNGEFWTATTTIHAILP